MKEKIKCTIRYSILALVTGVAVGAIDTIFGRGLLWLSDFRTAHYRYLLPFLPVSDKNNLSSDHRQYPSPAHEDP